MDISTRKNEHVNGEINQEEMVSGKWHEGFNQITNPSRPLSVRNQFYNQSIDKHRVHNPKLA